MTVSVCPTPDAGIPSDRSSGSQGWTGQACKLNEAPGRANGDLLRQLDLTNFRNYARFTHDFVPGLNLLLGPNGQGKTNLLEAIHYLAFLRSFRTRQISELVRWGTSVFQLRANLRATAGVHTWDLTVQHGAERQLTLCGAPVDRGSEFVNQYLCVAFLPEDIELVRGVATHRRRFLDMLIGQLDRGALPLLHQYGQALKSRNQVLRNLAKYGARALEAYEGILARLGAPILIARRALVTALNEAVSEVSPPFFRDAPMVVQYRPGLPKDAGTEPETVAALEPYLRAVLLQSRERDQRDCVTGFGPHRDELAIVLRGQALGVFGSEGECRAGAIVLRLAAMELLRRREPANRALVVLVDDVLGELDATRRRTFWERLRPCPQIFFACTDPTAIAVLHPEAVFEVAGGHVSRGATAGD